MILQGVAGEVAWHHEARATRESSARDASSAFLPSLRVRKRVAVQHTVAGLGMHRQPCSDGFRVRLFQPLLVQPKAQ